MKTNNFLQHHLGLVCATLWIAACSAPTSGPDASDVGVQPSDTTTDTTTDAPSPADVQEIDAVELDSTPPPADVTVSDSAPDADPCAMGQTRCGATCVDTETSSMNCGACGMACPATQRCAMGRCGCAATQTLCGGACVDTSSSVMHCGACDNACPSSQVCTRGACRVDCPLPLTVCGSGAMMVCSDNSSDLRNCGMCGNVCPSAPNTSATCSLGTCGVGPCNAGFGNCDMMAANGCEVTFATDVRNCGRCANVCPPVVNGMPACATGACGVGACNPGFGDCDTMAANGCEAALANDVRNCGRCGMVCASGESCVAGACTSAGFVATPPSSPVLIPASAGCTLLNDTNADQIDIAPDNTVWVVLRCGGVLRVSRSTDRARTFSAPVIVPFIGSTQAATLLARSSNNLIVLAAVGANVESLTTTNGGINWAGPSLVGLNFQSVGPGPALSMVEQPGLLFATYSSNVPPNTTSIFRSVNSGTTWTAFGQAMLTGPNYCPDLFAWNASDLLLTNESGRQVFRSGATIAGWGNIGVLGASGGFTDFAFGGTLLYANSSGGLLWRGVVTPMSVASAVSAPVASSTQRSMDADIAGNLAFAAEATPNVNIVFWQAGAPTPAPLITRTIPGAASTTPAIAAIPSGVRGAVLVAAGAAGVYAFVVLP